MFNWVSNNTPKFLTLWDGFIAVSPTDIPFDLNLDIPYNVFFKLLYEDFLW